MNTFDADHAADMAAIRAGDKRLPRPDELTLSDLEPHTIARLVELLDEADAVRPDYKGPSAARVWLATVFDLCAMRNRQMMRVRG